MIAMSKHKLCQFDIVSDNFFLNDWLWALHIHCVFYIEFLSYFQKHVSLL